MTLYQAVHAAFVADSPAAKVELTADLSAQFASGNLSRDDSGTTAYPETPGLPSRIELVHPNRLKRRSPHTENGRAILIHAIAHIEFNAINLALDAVLRFRDMPDAFVADWLRVAEEEAMHFGLVSQRLQDYGYAYGDFPAHNGLWDVARQSSHDVLERMAVVPRVLEARGLDVTPAMQQKLREAGDVQTCDILDTIFSDEIGHVATGTHWFEYLCRSREIDTLATFRDIIQRYYGGALRGPFNHEARLKAGFGKIEMDMLEALNRSPEQ